MGDSVFQAKSTFKGNAIGRSWFHTHSLCEAVGSVAFRWHPGDRGSDEAHDSSATSSCCPQGLCQGCGQCLPLLPLPHLAQPVPGGTRGCGWDTTEVRAHATVPKSEDLVRRSLAWGAAKASLPVHIPTCTCAPEPGPGLPEPRGWC